MSFEQQVWNAWNAGIYFIIAVVVFLVLTHRSEDHGPTLLARLVGRYIMLRNGGVGTGGRSVQNEPIFAGSNPEPEPTNPANLASESRTDDRTWAFALNEAERLAVTKMIYHKTSNERATKASAILAGFGVKKGDSAAYRRASAIYDSLFVLPEPEKFHPARTPDQDQRREALGLSK